MRLVAELNLYRWAGCMLVDAGRVRRQGRLSARLAIGQRPVEGIER
jgi:trehalose 6-phosphate synthase